MISFGRTYYDLWIVDDDQPKIKCQKPKKQK